ncbi:MAG: HD domain-containing protein [Acidobacteriaceae bacterium]|nr:HD domain-containing protein [Acidobacteriaceae bacterium]
MVEVAIEALSIVLIDGQERTVRFLRFALESAGYQDVRVFTDPATAVTACMERSPDLVVLGLAVHHYDGLRLMTRLREERSGEFYFPILVLAGDLSSDVRLETMLAGAKDFLSMPVNAAEILLKVRTLLETRALYKHLQIRNRTLENKVEERTRDLAEAQIEILHRLAIASEYRDDETGQHIQRVGLLAAMLAQQVGRPANEVELLRIAAPLHDVGKIGVPDRILRKPGRLTNDEFQLMQSHTLIGSNILGGSRFTVLQMAAQIARSHHERWNGSGYPEGLAGEAIPFAARATAIADAFDALTHPRPYKEAWSLEKAMATIQGESGRHFDPALVPPFLSLLRAEGLGKLATRLSEENRHANRINLRALDESVLVPRQSIGEPGQNRPLLSGA